jgi:hypothetical protein
MSNVQVEIVIAGTTPLLCNRFTDEAAMSASSGNRMSAVGEKGTPKEQSEKKLYLGAATRKPMIPQPNLFRCIIDAGTFFKAGKSKVTTQKSSMIPACVEVQGIELPLESKEGWAVDTRAVRIPSTGGRILCHRPSFNDWRITFCIDLDTSMLTVKLLREIVDAAGKRIGLGDFRPACKGPFGRFCVVNWKEHEAKLAA